MHDPNSAANPNLNIPSTTPAGLTSAFRTPSVDLPGRTAHQDTAKAAATREAIRVMIATQKASIVQGQADREASALQMSCIEEAILLLSMKAEPTPPPPAHEPLGRVNLQKFKTTNGPIFSEPFHAIEPFVNWVKALEIFFLTKGIIHHTDKIAIVGSLIQETNTLAFYASKTDILGTITWLKFKDLIFGFALPPLWQTTLKLRLRKLHMSETESFLTYSTRGRCEPEPLW
ncbi:hypothetical protein PCASD_06926 [Puccinia coronata f. sp. avenae]|uniref:Retrotransposon gag domain-containing protein n=1 Tax=Puccinia coronata f. sp. avenae TaxID=200324 RepID=A0A2N5V4V2_9BASI|nr:hypothetical protein PCASD_06926 [Puccinia coronata f. sp. avenae]